MTASSPLIASAAIPLAEAQSIANDMIALLDGAFDRILVVGSVRRQRPTVHDIEFLIEPRFASTPDRTSLFGGAVTRNCLEDRMDRLVHEERVNPKGLAVKAHAWGPRLKRFAFRDVQVELYGVLPPSQWGVGSIIRTGPADFSHQLVTPSTQSFVDADGSRRYGWLDRGMRVHQLGLYLDGQLIETPEEEDVFEVLRRQYIAPEDRR